uniref:Uncharacterized protein n=1 Tax=Caenorhabditis japonica TaxID=281687 RepID=A0A8R1ENG5_CAEJA
MAFFISCIGPLGEEKPVERMKTIDRLNTSITSIDFTATGVLQPAMGSSFPLSLAISFGEHLQSLQYQRKSLLKPTTIDKFIKGQKKNFEQIATMAGYTFNATTNSIVETLGDIKDFYKEYIITVGTALSSLVLIAI